MNKVALSIVCLLAVPALAAAQPEDMAFPPARVQIATAELRDMAPLVEVAGTVVSLNDSRIATEIEGVLTWLAEVGQEVEAGDVVARIEPRLTQVALTRARANVARLEAELRYRERQLERAATARIKWWDTIERASKPVSEALIAMAAIEQGSRVLDVATGLGEPAGMAAERVGPTGHVTAIDINPAQVAFAATRLAGLGLENVTIAEADAGRLELEDASFDAALCRWGLMFLPDLPSALAGLRRLVRGGGRFATAAWDEPGQVPFLGVERQVLRAYLPDGYFSGDNDLTTPFRLSAPGHLERLLLDAGLANVRCERVDVTYDFASPADYTAFRRDMGGRDLILAKHHPPEKVEEIWAQVTDAARPYAGADGAVRMTAKALCAVGIC